MGLLFTFLLVAKWTERRLIPVHAALVVGAMQAIGIARDGMPPFHSDDWVAYGIAVVLTYLVALVWAMIAYFVVRAWRRYWEPHRL